MSNIWMPLYVADYLADTGHLSTAEHGAYLLLIMHYWQKEAPLPDNDRILAQIARLSLERWRKIRPELEGFFAVQSGVAWTHDYVERELKKAAILREKKSAAGRASANARSTGVQQVYQQNTQQNGNQPQSQLQKKKDSIGASQAKPPPPRKTRRSIPDDFPLEPDLEWSRTLWLQRGRADLCAMMPDEIARFRDHHIQHGKSMADWPAAWRTWARNAIKFSNGAHNGRAKPPTAHDKFFAAAESLIREELSANGPGESNVVSLPSGRSLLPS